MAGQLPLPFPLLADFAILLTETVSRTMSFVSALLCMTLSHLPLHLFGSLEPGESTHHQI